MNLLCKLTIVIAWHRCLFSMAQAVSSTVGLVNTEISNSVNLFNFAMCDFSTKCFYIKLVACSDGWQRTRWQMIHIMPGLLFSSIPQCKQNRHNGAFVKLFQGMEHFKPTFVEAHEASNMIRNGTSLKFRKNSSPCLDDIITSSNKVFEDFESDIAVGIWTQRNPTCETVTSIIIVM